MGKAQNHLFQEAVEDFDAAVYDLSFSEEFRISGGYYVFMNNYNGQLKAHGNNQSNFGRRFADVYFEKGLGTLQKGQEIHAGFVTAAEGSGWVEYEWRDSTEDDTYAKIALLVKVEFDSQSYYLGVGFKFGRDPVSNFDVGCSSEYNSPWSFATALALSSHALAYAISSPSNSTDAIFEKISVGGEFRTADFYVFAYNFDGYCVAHGQDYSYVNMTLAEVFEKKGSI